VVTIDISQKERGLLCPFRGGARYPSNTVWPGRGVPACQVSSWSIQPFGHNTPTSQTDRQDRTDRQHRQRSDSLGCPFGGGGAGFPSNRMWPGPWPTCMPSFTLIHLTVWPLYTNVTESSDRTTLR